MLTTVQRAGVALGVLPTVLCVQVLPGQDSGQDAAAVAAVQPVRVGDGQGIRLDGVLDEPVWQGIPPATDFLQQDPLEGQPATERTEVRIVYDRGNLYIGPILYDSDPEGILAFQKQRDHDVEPD